MSFPMNTIYISTRVTHFLFFINLMSLISDKFVEEIGKMVYDYDITGYTAMNI